MEIACLGCSTILVGGERTLQAVTYTSGSIYRPPLELPLVIELVLRLGEQRWNGTVQHLSQVRPPPERRFLLYCKPNALLSPAQWAWLGGISSDAGHS
jgi:hypothetical protein